MVCDPRTSINPSVFNQLDDARKIRRECVAAGEQRQLAAVQDRCVRKRNRLLGNADIDQPPGKRAVIQRLAHRLVAAGGVHHHIGKLALGQLVQSLQLLAIALGKNRVGHAQLLAHERQALSVHVHHNRLRAAKPGEFNDGKTDRPRADDEDVLARLWTCAIDGMATDSQGFDQRKLLESQLARDVQLAGGQNHSLAHAAIAHDAEGFMILATVRVSATARVTLLAVDVRFHCTEVARLYVRHTVADREHFDAEFVPRNARVTEERHFAEVTAVIRAANADAMNAHQRLARAGLVRLGDFNPAERQRVFELDGFHEIVAKA